ncbi:hypothetical protein SAMN02745975_01984 [Geosporobacter subterraneus DSM 17957]|uniref:Uncharacterized protein n=1 Tax=Geosporobacter subterraneus DSM 17957 TaxID=1121919 RepID=A0A1M6IXX5_9FIRM|nr:hypothetical protein [Geosporobacter subterraneus]SHJ39288.1 hypothetical protein SAMN02745975_01984 [Geosporobacter subterraneus DSM 17957]
MLGCIVIFIIVMFTGWFIGTLNDIQVKVTNIEAILKDKEKGGGSND